MCSKVAGLLKGDTRFADKYVVSRGSSESSPFRCFAGCTKTAGIASGDADGSGSMDDRPEVARRIWRAPAADGVGRRRRDLGFIENQSRRRDGHATLRRFATGADDSDGAVQD